MADCIFCKIIAGEIPSYTIYEDEEFKVILDINPASKGHALILPKVHYANLYEIDEEVAARAMKLAKKLASRMTDVLGCDGFNLLQNNHEAAGQTVFHFHMHLIPRYKWDNQLIGWKPMQATQEELEETIKKAQEQIQELKAMKDNKVWKPKKRRKILVYFWRWENFSKNMGQLGL